MINIRTLQASDTDIVSNLLADLGYTKTQPYIHTRIAQLLAHPDAELLVATVGHAVVGVISLHFIPQLALTGDFCRISYFCVDTAARGTGIGTALEARAVELARARGCDRIEVHCHSRRVDAHRFYRRQGYIESPKYFIKSLTEN